MEQAIEAGCAFVNGISVFIASSEYWAKRFGDAKLPILGDDVCREKVDSFISGDRNE